MKTHSAYADLVKVDPSLRAPNVYTVTTNLEFHQLTVIQNGGVREYYVDGLRVDARLFREYGVAVLPGMERWVFRDRLAQVGHSDTVKLSKRSLALAIESLFPKV